MAGVTTKGFWHTTRRSRRTPRSHVVHLCTRYVEQRNAGGAAHGILPSHARSFTASRLGTRRRPRHLSWNSRSRARYHRGRLICGREAESEPAAETDSGVRSRRFGRSRSSSRRLARRWTTVPTATRVAYRTIEIRRRFVTLGHPGRRTSRFSEHTPNPGYDGRPRPPRISSRFSFSHGEIQVKIE